MDQPKALTAAQAKALKKSTFSKGLKDQRELEEGNRKARRNAARKRRGKKDRDMFF